MTPAAMQSAIDRGLVVGPDAVADVDARRAAGDAERVRYDEVGLVYEPPLHGRPLGALGRSWTAALARMMTGGAPARLVLVADSMGELSTGWRTYAWDPLSRALAGQAAGTYERPFWSSWPTWPHGGTAQPLGLDRRGAAIGPGVTFGPIAPVAVPATLDVYYTATPDGSTVDVTWDGAPLGTIDTTLDENGDPVAEPVQHQRWRSPAVAATGTWSMTTGVTGTLRLEAVARPPAHGIEVHGTGRSGQSTADAHDAVVGYVAAMLARGEPPDAVVLAADTAEDATAAAPAVTALAAALRALVPGLTVAHMVPAGHASWGASEAAQDAQAEVHRAADVAAGLLIVDAYAATGPAWSGHDPNGYHSEPDFVHHNQAGKAAVGAAFLETLGAAAMPAPRLARAVIDGEPAQDVRVAADGTLTADNGHTWVQVKRTDNALLELVGGGPIVSVQAGLVGEDYARLEVSTAGVMEGDGTAAPARKITTPTSADFAIIGSSRTLSANESGYLAVITGSGAGMVLTLPYRAGSGFLPMWHYDIVNTRAATVALAAEAGASLRAADGTPVAIKANGRVRIVAATQSNVWWVEGDYTV